MPLATNPIKLFAETSVIDAIINMYYNHTHSAIDIGLNAVRVELDLPSYIIIIIYGSSIIIHHHFHRAIPTHLIESYYHIQTPMICI